MAYQDIVLQDSPDIYFTLDGSGAPTNLGSSAGTGVISQGSAVTNNGAPAKSDIGGQSKGFPRSNANAFISRTAYNSSGNWTIEAWYKNDSGTFDSDIKTVFRVAVSTSNYWEIAYRQSDGTVQIYDTAGINESFINNKLRDGNWHHFAVVGSGSTNTFYVDGVSVYSINGTVATKSNATVYLSLNTAIRSLGGSLDEFALYKTALAPERIAARYNYSASTGVTNPSPVMTLSLTAPDVNVRVQNPYSSQTSVSTKDRESTGNGTATGVTINASKIGLFAFDNIVYPQSRFVLDSAAFNFNVTAPSGGTTFNYGLITSSWDESGDTTPSITWSSITSSSSAGTVDLTPMLKAWEPNGPKYGIAVRATGTIREVYIGSRENATAATRPSMTIKMSEFVGTSIRVPVPASSMTLNMPQHRSSAGTTQNAPAMSILALSSITPVVKTTKSTLINAPVFNSSMSFPGGDSRLRDQTQRTTAMVAYLTSPNANVIIGKDVKNTAPTMNAGTLSAVAPKVDNRTSKRNFVIGTMGLSLRAPSNITINGIKTSDRYSTFIPTTTNPDDIWFKMEETTGTVALDSVGNGTNLRANGEYVGPVQFNVAGPQDRRAIRFDNGSYVKFNYESNVGAFPFDSSGSDLTLEFSLKTGVKNGTLWATRESSASVVLENGFIVIRSRDGLVLRVRQDVADNQWHHVIISFSKNSSRGLFVLIDGQIILRRVEIDPLLGNYIAPVRFPLVTADAKDFIVRINDGLTEEAAQQSYYEWSNSLRIKTDAMVLNLSAPAPFRVKGNVKKMLLIHGLPFFQSNQGLYLYNYKAVYAGLTFGIDGFGESTPNAGQNQLSGNNVFYDVKPFRLNDYLVYPVGITGSVDKSSEGLVSNEYRNGRGDYPYIDDETGRRRFFDINKDLNVDKSDFDVVTVANYPNPAPGRNTVTGSRHPDVLLGTEFQWAQARDAFRDSLLKAAYTGTSFWITEPEMAQHMGFIQEYDVHTLDGWLRASTKSYPDRNVAARELDRANLTNFTVPVESDLGDYEPRWQANRYRRIVSLENDLTNIPSWHMSDVVSYTLFDFFAPHGGGDAWNLVDRTNGLLIGDRIPMSVDRWNFTDNQMAPINPNANYSDAIVSARPDGVVGKIIAREALAYNQANTTTLKANPWRNNVVTIAAERGTVVRGRSITGRVFIEFMDRDVRANAVLEDADKTYWKGEKKNQPWTLWAYDTRRQSQIIVSTIISKSVQRGNTIVSFNDEQRIINYGYGDLIARPYASMNRRGLNWLSKVSTLPAGQVRVNAPAMEVNLDSVAPKLTKTRNISTKVTGSMRTDLEMRNTFNFKANSVRNKALPMVLNLEMRGFGKVNKVPAMEMTLTSRDVRVTAGGDRVILYLNADREFTTFLKEND